MPLPDQCEAVNCPFVKFHDDYVQELREIRDSIRGLTDEMIVIRTERDHNREIVGLLKWGLGILIALAAFMHDHLAVLWRKG